MLLDRRPYGAQIEKSHVGNLGTLQLQLEYSGTNRIEPRSAMLYRPSRHQPALQPECEMECFIESTPVSVLPVSFLFKHTFREQPAHLFRKAPLILIELDTAEVHFLAPNLTA